MPVIMTADFPNIDPELYAKTHADVMSGGRPVGMIAHCCKAKGRGISVVDIWESHESFEAFAAEKLQPALKKLNIEGGPENVTVSELLNADAFDYEGVIRSS